MNPEIENFNFKVQAHLLIGKQETLIEYTQNLLKRVFCKRNTCNSCITCTQVKQNKYENILWFKPEKRYTLEQIEDLFKIISFSLNNNEKFFIIFEQSDSLGANCSNKLLKTIEEPKNGYYFIFLAQKEQLILSTIRSRCTTKYFYNEKEQTISSIADLFINIKNTNPSIFLKKIDELNLSEQEATELLDFLLNYWITKHKESLLNNEELRYCNSIIKILTEEFQYPLMPGSSKIFLKNLFIKLGKS